MEITLTRIHLLGVSGITTAFSRSAEDWIKEIYQHQIHRLLSGYSIFKGALSIATVARQGLFVVPYGEYKKHGIIGVLKKLKKGGFSLIQTITKVSNYMIYLMYMYLIC